MNKTNLNKRILTYISIIILVIYGSGCSNINKTLKEVTVNKEENQASFDEFVNQLFVDDVQSDSITLNYTLAKPESYGITDFTPTLGDASIEKMKENLVKAENTSKTLSNFSRSALTKKQQLLYDILVDYYTITGNEEKFFLYGEPLGNTTGIQGQLPVLLAEYNFYDKEDITKYIQVLQSVEDYFSQLVEYEKQKSKAGLFMSDTTADNIISQCEDFTEKPEENYLIDIFNDRIDDYEGLTKKEKADFKKENKDAILNHVIPAYQMLTEELKKLKGTGKNNGGVCHFPDGKEYYEQLAKGITGSNMTIKEMKTALIKTMRSASLKMDSIYRNDEGIYDDFFDMKFPMQDPEKILTYLEDAVKEDFPTLEPVNCTIKYVHKSLEDHLSPAFYLTPAIDNYSDNSVYINGGKDNDLTQIFPTVAHESYPGHLLQNVYFNQQKPEPVRSLMNYGGYSEGWATYCEMYSYDICGIEANVAEFAKQYNILNLCLYAQMDIGVNYDGWDLDELKEFLSGYGITDEDAAKSVYDLVIDDPANYLQYVIGYIEFANLRSTAEDTLGDKFNAKNFHTFLLDIGPAPFSLIADYMDEWMKEQ